MANERPRALNAEDILTAGGATAEQLADLQVGAASIPAQVAAAEGFAGQAASSADQSGAFRDQTSGLKTDTQVIRDQALVALLASGKYGDPNNKTVPPSGVADGQNYLIQVGTDRVQVYLNTGGTGAPVSGLLYPLAGAVDALTASVAKVGVRVSARSGVLAGKLNMITGRLPEATFTGGTSYSSPPQLSLKSVARSTLTGELQVAIPLTISARSGILGGKVNAVTGRLIEAQFTDGTSYSATGGVTQVARSNLAATLDTQIFRERSQIWQEMADGVRQTKADVALTTHSNGYAWIPFGPQITPLIEGITAAAMQFRRVSLLLTGRNFAGTFNPSANGAASTVQVGTFSNSATYGIKSMPAPSGYSEGQYFKVFSVGGGAIVLDGNASGTVYNGDLIVLHNGAWVVQAGPSSNINSNPRDWWTINATGTFDGKVYAVGDIMFGLGSAYYDAYVKGSPETGQKFLAGEWSPASGAFPVASSTAPLLPAPADGMVWQATSAGTVGGITFATDDYLVRYQGTWGRMASENIVETAIGSYVNLRCQRGASEWEGRAKDKGSVRSVVLQGLVQVAKRVEVIDNSAVLYSHSIGDFLRSALTAAFGTRPLSVRAFNSASGSEIISVGVEADIINGTFPTGKLVMGLLGQNDEANLSRAINAHLRLFALCGMHDNYYLPWSDFGRRTVTWNGTRFVGEWQEPLAKGGSPTNMMVRERQALNDNFGGRYFDPLLAALAGVTSTVPQLQFPGMNGAQVAAAYGLLPEETYIDLLSSYGVNPATANYVGDRAVTGLPTGGSPGDYYRRTADGTGTEYTGNIIANVGGTWTEVLLGSGNSTVHPQSTSKAVADASAAAVQLAIALGYIK